MESKDVILVLLIPLLVIAALFVGPRITGFAIYENENVLGKYSINPSFIIETGYNLEEYKDLRIKLKTAIEECKTYPDIKSCIESKTAAWKCQEDNMIVSIMNELKDKLNECSLVEDGVCTFEIDKRSSLNENFEYKLQKSGRRIKIISKDASDFLNIENLAYVQYDNKDVLETPVDEIAININYENGDPVIVFKANNVELSSKAFYKKGPLKLDKLEENSFTADQANSIIEVPKQSGMKFCARQQSGLEYRFAITFPSPPLDTVSSLEISDAKNSENKAWIKWNELPGAKSYNVYYSEKEFVDVKIVDIKSDESIKKISLNKNDAQIIQSLENLNLNKLYKLDESFFVLINAVDGNLVNYAVTALDNNGNELDNNKEVIENTMILSKGKNYVSFVSVDDLAPGKIEDLKMTLLQIPTLEFQKPLKNSDGTDAADVGYFNIYYKDGNHLILDNTFSVFTISIAQAGCESIKTACSFPPGFASGHTYSIGVSALDENRNENKKDIDVKQFIIQ